VVLEAAEDQGDISGSPTSLASFFSTREALPICSEVKKLKSKQIIKTVKTIHVHRESNRKSPKMGKYRPYHKTEGLGIRLNRLCTNKGS
jgi:hypothetical protein